MAEERPTPENAAIDDDEEDAGKLEDFDAALEMLEATESADPSENQNQSQSQSHRNSQQGDVDTDAEPTDKNQANETTQYLSDDTEVEAQDKVPIERDEDTGVFTPQPESPMPRASSDETSAVDQY